MGAGLQNRINTFMEWIRPDPDKVDEARVQRDGVRDAIKGKASADGLIVKSTPASGSFAKATGLRRHMYGGAEHEGQDIDCAFVVAKNDKEGDVLTELLGRFEGYAKACFPNTPRTPTKSSIKVSFVASKLNFDLVPMLEVEKKDDEQILLRAGGERRRTSVQKHVEFTRTRTAKSREVTGATFNDGLRLIKWWREYRVTESKILTDVPTFLIDLLCAKAFDEAGMASTWAATLELWFDRIHAYARHHTFITFRDYGMAQPSDSSGMWKVIDPVNSANNAVPASWSAIEIDELRDWAEAARDTVRQANAYDLRGRDADAAKLVAAVFGPAFLSHSENA